MSEQQKMDADLRQIVTEALVSMISGVTGLVPPSGPGSIPDFVQAPIDRAVERISASLPVGVPDELTEVERKAIVGLIELASHAFHVADNGEDAGGETISVPRCDMDDLGNALDSLDELPDDMPGYTLGPSGRAEWALRRFFGGTTIAGQESIAQTVKAEQWSDGDNIKHLADCDVSGCGRCENLMYFYQACDECGAWGHNDAGACACLKKSTSLPADSDLTASQCACGDEYPANSYDAGFIAGSGMCQVCDAAMPPKDLPAAEQSPTDKESLTVAEQSAPGEVDAYAVAEAVRTALDRQACPNAWMVIAYEATVAALAARDAGVVRVPVELLTILASEGLSETQSDRYVDAVMVARALLAQRERGGA